MAEAPKGQGARYSAEQAQALLRKAAELQAAASTRESDAGLSLSELRAAAAEAGIDPRYVEMAASLGAPPTRTGLGLVLEYERVIPGEFRMEDADVLADLLPNNAQSFAMQVGRSLRGQFVKHGHHVRVQLTARDGETRLHVRAAPFVLFMATAYPLILTGFVLSINFLARGFFGVGAALFGGLGLLGWLLFSALRRSFRGQVDQFVEELTNRVARATHRHEDTDAAVTRDEPTQPLHGQA